MYIGIYEFNIYDRLGVGIIMYVDKYVNIYF